MNKKKYFSVLSSTNLSDTRRLEFQNNMARFVAPSLVYRRLKFDFAKATNKPCHICNNATGKRQLSTQVFFGDGKQRNVLGFQSRLGETRGGHASVSVALANTIFSPGLKAGIPMYGQLAQRKASPR